MYIAHYKSVNSAEEFFSSKRKSLDFPTQIEYKGRRYLLHATHLASTNKQVTNMKNRAKELNIPFGIKLD